MADFETLVLTEEEIKQGKGTYVWAWAICQITDDKPNTVYGTSIRTFFEYIQTLPKNSIVYFHNLKYDGQFILSYILQNNWTQVISNKKMKNKTFCALVSEIGVWYSIQLQFKDTNILIYDSLKKLPFTVDIIAKQLGFSELKGHIDYKAYRAEDGILSDEDKDYIRRDVEIVAKAIHDVCFSKDMYKMTIGADCMNFYKSMTPNFEKMFPKLLPDVDYKCRQAYKGGYCYVNPKIARKLLKKNGSTYDYNSMYPSVMHSQLGCYYPIGIPDYYVGEYIKSSEYPLFIQHFKCMFKLKKGYVPTVQIKNNNRYQENEYLEEVQETIELYMTNVDFEIFFEHYEVFDYDPIDGFQFHAWKGMFDKYIDYWYKYKEEATIKKDKVGRMVAKLMLNNLYGKFATSTDSTTQQFYFEDDVVKHTNNYDEKDGVYVPVGAFITAYARKELITAIQANFEVFCYCDTDSIHILADDAKNIKVHDSALGYWKKESTWTMAKFIRQKTYAEFINNEWDIKACGANDDVKKNIIDINKFDLGASYPGKKTVKKVKGGVVLVDCNFTII